MVEEDQKYKNLNEKIKNDMLIEGFKKAISDATFDLKFGSDEDSKIFKSMLNILNTEAYSSCHSEVAGVLTRNLERLNIDDENQLFEFLEKSSDKNIILNVAHNIPVSYISSFVDEPDRKNYLCSKFTKITSNYDVDVKKAVMRNITQINELQENEKQRKSRDKLWSVNSYLDIYQASKDKIARMPEEKRRITGVAVCREGKVYFLPEPARHSDVIQMLIKKRVMLPPVRQAEQGFVDQNGKFLTREDAAKLALANGQCKKLRCPSLGILFSEDLW